MFRCILSFEDKWYLLQCKKDVVCRGRRIAVGHLKHRDCFNGCLFRQTELLTYSCHSIYRIIEVDFHQCLQLGDAISKLSEEQIFYMRQRGLSENEAVSLSVNGFVNDLVKEFPMEYSVELKRLIELQMEGAVG